MSRCFSAIWLCLCTMLNVSVDDHLLIMRFTRSLHISLCNSLAFLTSRRYLLLVVIEKLSDVHSYAPVLHWYSLVNISLCSTANLFCNHLFDPHPLPSLPPSLPFLAIYNPRLLKGDLLYSAIPCRGDHSERQHVRSGLHTCLPRGLRERVLNHTVPPNWMIDRYTNSGRRFRWSLLV